MSSVALPTCFTSHEGRLFQATTVVPALDLRLDALHFYRLNTGPASTLLRNPCIHDATVLYNAELDRHIRLKSSVVDPMQQSPQQRISCVTEISTSCSQSTTTLKTTRLICENEWSPTLYCPPFMIWRYQGRGFLFYLAALLDTSSR